MVTPELQQYVTAARAAGQTDEMIRGQLLGTGWQISDVDSVLGDTPGVAQAAGEPRWFYALLPYYLPIGILSLLVLAAPPIISFQFGLLGLLMAGVLTVMWFINVGLYVVLAKLFGGTSPLLKKSVLIFSLFSIVGSTASFVLKVIQGEVASAPEVLVGTGILLTVCMFAVHVALIKKIFEIRLWKALLWTILYCVIAIGTAFAVFTLPILIGWILFTI